ncbi:MAG TPA: hypothetical protein VGM51_06490 [Armatimonadota bacterium]|jgi:hypothetical protein
MTTIERAADLLACNLDLVVLREEDTIQVRPIAPTGFLVQITEQRGTFTVYYDGWHESFDDADTAFRCFAWGLSSHARLKVVSARGIAYRWTAETLIDGEWGVVSTTGLLFWPFWRRSTTRYLQNEALLDPDVWIG